MNVALTRAKYQLVCLGNVACMKRMEGATTLQMLAKNAEERSVISSYGKSHNPPTLQTRTNAQLDLFYGEPSKRAKLY
jgi:superfamily I DNA and/or RNA helicase